MTTMTERVQELIRQYPATITDDHKRKKGVRPGVGWMCLDKDASTQLDVSINLPALPYLPNRISAPAYFHNPLRNA